MMAQKADQAETKGAAPFIAAFPEVSALATKRMEEISQLQAQLFQGMPDINKRWMDRMQSEAALAAQFTAKLAAAHSVPDAASAWEEWITRRMEMATEDAKLLLADSQKISEAATAFLSSGFKAGPNGGDPQSK